MKEFQRVINIIDDVISSELSRDCTFWACRGNPNNNRIESMITCSRCQTIIELRRSKKKLLKTQK